MMIKQLLVLNLLIVNCLTVLPCLNPTDPLCTALLASRCSFNVVRRDHLVGDAYSFECNTVNRGFQFQRITSGVDLAQDIVEDDRHVIIGSTLTITNVNSSDEGTYTCLRDGLQTHQECLVVSATARFANCNSVPGSEIMYSPDEATELNSCYQNLTVQEGRVELDTEIEYIGGGHCNCVEDIQRLAIEQMFRQNMPIFTCTDNTPGDNSCNRTMNGVTTRRTGDNAYDRNLVFTNLRVSEAGKYYVELEVQEKSINNARRLYKVFDITVLSTPPTTANPVTTMSQTITVASSTPRLSVISSVDELALMSSVTGGVAAAIVVTLVIVVLIVIAGVLLYRRSSTESKPIPPPQSPIKEQTDIEVTAYHVTTLYNAHPLINPEAPTVVIEEQSLQLYASKHYSLYCDNVELPVQKQSEAEPECTCDV